MICSESIASIQTIQKNKPSPVDGYVMPNKDYDDLLEMALQRGAAKTQLQVCLDRKEKLEEKSVLPWLGAGVLMGFLGAAALMGAK